MVLLDTSALSAAMHRRPAAMERLRQVGPDEVIICAPAAAEVHYGLERLPQRSRRRRLLTREFQFLREAARWVDWTEPAARSFGQIKAALENAGQRIDDMDVAIAAIALNMAVAVATCNVRHFERIKELSVHDWSALD
jgi:tRNA(fMet)-specific endonuclease VapC